MALFLAFVIVPLIEIALFVQVGGAIGLWPTLGIVVLTAILGTSLMRSQGRQVMARLSSSFSELRDPTEPLAEGAMILFAGVLLLTPGFFTDAVGFALLLPPVRHAILRKLASRVTVQGFQTGFQSHAQYSRSAKDDIVDAEFTDVTPKEPRKPSGWVSNDGDRH